jgi:3-oxoacyl-[acyl-carrier protein] reductase
MGKLSGKTAVVTGASKGIGAGIAKSLAAEGAAVVVNYASSRKDADAVVAHIEGKGGKAVAVQGDVSKAVDVQKIFAAAKQAFGGVDVLVNNAGVYNLTPLEALAEDDFHRQFNINVLGLLFATEAAAKLFGAEGGSVINIGSAASALNPPNSVVYTATKGAVDAVTRVLAKELGPRKIRVNSINPGVIETEGTHAMGVIGGDLEKQFVALTPLGRTGQPEDVAPVAVFLASDESRWITGETLVVSGGLR